MTRGRYRALVLAPASSLVAGGARGAVARRRRRAPLALAGLLAYEHAYVQAGQAVPLA